VQDEEYQNGRMVVAVVVAFVTVGGQALKAAIANPVECLRR